jgi:hypothetical protein
LSIGHRCARSLSAQLQVNNGGCRNKNRSLRNTVIVVMTGKMHAIVVISWSISLDYAYNSYLRLNAGGRGEIQAAP